MLLENVVTLLIRFPFHVEQKLLLCNHGQVAEVLDFVTLNLKEGSQIVLILEDILLEAGR